MKTDRIGLSTWLKERVDRIGHSSLITVLAGGVVLTLVLFVAVGWNVWSMYLNYTKVMKSELRLQELIDTITYLDEVLTMSARMAAATGDLQWEERYLEFVPKLELLRPMQLTLH